ncbi:unnamed protein product [Cuscuta europaea]|uniref:Uncharacterized protein n=1 Tax=Cuscuta europaea TaxID=41803 RepID=A0A9P0YBY1_CUSEU|nr:unnamed protein product [Cuscuta europaea]
MYVSPQIGLIYSYFKTSVYFIPLLPPLSLYAHLPSPAHNRFPFSPVHVFSFFHAHHGSASPRPSPPPSTSPCAPDRSSSSHAADFAAAIKHINNDLSGLKLH